MIPAIEIEFYAYIILFRLQQSYNSKVVQPRLIVVQVISQRIAITEIDVNPLKASNIVISFLE